MDNFKDELSEETENTGEISLDSTNDETQNTGEISLDNTSDEKKVDFSSEDNLFNSSVEEETLDKSEVENVNSGVEDNDNDIVVGNIPVESIEEVKEDNDLPSEVVTQQYNGGNDDFGEEKSSKGILVAIILVIAVVVVLLVLKGCNKDEKYTIKFDTNGGNTISEQVVNKNEKAKTPSTPTRDGYKFLGWYVGDEEFNFDSKIDKDTTIEAKWEKIEDVKVTGVTLDQTEVTVKVGATLQLTAIVTPENAKDKSVTWSSSDEDIVAVDENGNLTAKKKGTATIKVTTTDGSYEATCKVTVSTDVVKVKEVTLDKTSATVGVNSTITLVATVKPKDASNKGVTWSSSDTSIATVENGKVKGLKEGKVTITAETKDGGYKATATITVKNIKVTGVTLNTTSKTIYVGDTYTLKATVKPTDASNKGVKWSSSDTSIVTVDGGKIKGIKEGTATITVTTKDGEYTATATITVKPAEVTKVSISGSSSVVVNKTITLKATVTANGNADKTVTWTSSDPEVATVNSKGVVTGKKAGTTTITAQAGNKKATKTITVTAAAPAKLNLTITFTAECVGGSSTISGYIFVIKNGTKEFTDYSVIIGKNEEGVEAVGSNGKIATLKTGKQNFTVKTNNNGYVTVSATVPSVCK